MDDAFYMQIEGFFSGTTDLVHIVEGRPLIGDWYLNYDYIFALRPRTNVTFCQIRSHTPNKNVATDIRCFNCFYT